MLRVANSTPMVDLESRLNSLRVNRLNRLDLPTPESPISTTRGGYVSSGEGQARRRWGALLTLEKELRTRQISAKSAAAEERGRLTSYSSFAMVEAWREMWLWWRAEVVKLFLGWLLCPSC